MEGHIVDGTEMVANARKLLLEDEMKEAGLELARARVQGGVDGLLTSAQQDVIVGGRDSRRVHRLLRLVGLELLERLGVEQLGREVLGGRDDTRRVRAPLQVHDLFGVRAGARGQLAALLAQVPQHQLARLVARDDRILQIGPHRARHLAVLHRRHVDLFHRLGLVRLAQIAHNNVALLAERTISGVHDQVAAVGEATRAHRVLLLKVVLDLGGARVPDLAGGVR